MPFVLVVSRCGARGRVTHGFTRLGRRSGVVPCRILRELGAPFQRHLAMPPPGHPGPRTPGSPRPGRSVGFEAFLPTASPFTSLSTVTPSRVRSVLSWAFLAPPEPCSRRDLEPSRSPAAAEPSLLERCACALRHTSRRSGPPRAHLSQLALRARSRATLDAGWIHTRTTETSRVVRRRTPDPLMTWAVPWSSLLGFLALREAAALTPMTSDAPSVSSRLASRARSTVTRGHG